MKEQPPSLLQRFASLTWYEEIIKFLFTFAAKTSELLLAAGLVTSTANFLTDGNVMGNGTNLAVAWAWAQALAIDSSLGVTFYYIFMSIKKRDWIKVFCYSLLTTLLAIVAGTITNVDTFSHAVHISIVTAITQVGLDIKFLTTLRAIAVVGFVLMSRLKDMSFKELYESASSAAPPSLKASATPEEINSAVVLIRDLVAEALAQQGRVILIEEQEMLPPSERQATKEISQQQTEGTSAQPDEKSQMNQEVQHSASLEERDARLTQAYRELQAEGKRISGRALAARVHIRRSVCSQWLATHHPEIPDEESE